MSQEAAARMDARTLYTTAFWTEASGETVTVTTHDHAPVPTATTAPMDVDLSDLDHTYSQTSFINVASAEDPHHALGISLTIARHIVAYRARLLHRR